jgi:hypothetical protein
MRPDDELERALEEAMVEERPVRADNHLSV